MIVTVTEFNSYVNNFESSTEVTALKTSVLESAEAVVVDYLGYDPTSSTRTDEYHNGSGKRYLYPYAKNITAVASVYEDDEEIEDYEIRGNALFRKSKFDSEKEYCITYTAGWASANMPQIIKTTILRIASLMWLETGGNIGLSARTSPDNSKTFISYNNYSKYLAPLDTLRIARF